MNQLNSLILEGNLARDAALTEPAPGFKKCMFAIGVNRYYKNKDNADMNEVSFFDIEAYGKMAEICESKAKKGRGIRVVGRLKQDTWKSDDGKNCSRVYVVAEHVEFKPVKKITDDAASETAETEEKQTANETAEVPVKEPVTEEAVF